MKKISIALLVLFSVIGYSQQKKIQGIGIFKIGSTKLSVIDSIINSGYETRTCSNLYDCSHYKVKGRVIYEMVKDTTELVDNNIPSIKDHRAFVLGEYIIAGIKLSPELYFYKDLLYKIKTNGQGDYDLQDALREKYNPILDVKKKVVTCRSKLVEFNEEETYITIEYRNDSINAVSFFDSYYDDSCNKQYRNSTLIYSKKENEIVNLKEEEAINFKKEKDKINKVKLLDKL